MYLIDLISLLNLLFVILYSNKNKLVAHVFAIDKQGADRSRYLKYATKGGLEFLKVLNCSLVA